MDALELSLRCSALLIRSVSNNLGAGEITDVNTTGTEQIWSDADYEKHFMEHGKGLLLFKVFFFGFCSFFKKRFM